MEKNLSSKSHNKLHLLRNLLGRMENQIFINEVCTQEVYKTFNIVNNESDNVWSFWKKKRRACFDNFLFPVPLPQCSFFFSAVSSDC